MGSNAGSREQGPAKGVRAHRRPGEAERWLRQEGTPEARAGAGRAGGIVASWAQS